MSGLGWDADGLCDDHNRFGCEACRMTSNPNPSPELREGELLPCPFCGGTDGDLVETFMQRGLSTDNDIPPLTADEAWNKRNAENAK